jgi:DNA-binding response OmpR family regulator
MYSTSSARKDIDMAYKLGALLFLTKPEDLRELSAILKIMALNSQQSFLSQLKNFGSIKMN